MRQQVENVAGLDVNRDTIVASARSGRDEAASVERHWHSWDLG